LRRSRAICRHVARRAWIPLSRCGRDDGAPSPEKCPLSIQPEFSLALRYAGDVRGRSNPALMLRRFRE
jgi:hypothetical protein